MSCFGRPSRNNDNTEHRRKSSSGPSLDGYHSNNNNTNIGSNNNGQNAPIGQFSRVYSFSFEGEDTKPYVAESQRAAQIKNIPFVKICNDHKMLMKHLETYGTGCLVMFFFEVHEQDKLDSLINALQSFSGKLNTTTFSIFLVGSVQSITKANNLRVKLILKGATEHTRAKLKIYPHRNEHSLTGAIDFIFTPIQRKAVMDEFTEDLFKRFKDNFSSPISSNEMSGREIADWLKIHVREGAELDDSQAIGYGQKLIQYCIIRHTERTKPFCCSPKIYYEMVQDKSGIPKYNPPPEW